MGHWLGDSRKTIAKFINWKHSFESLKNETVFMSVDLTSIGLEKNANLFLFQNFSDYSNEKLHFTAESSDEKAHRFNVGI